MTDERQQASSHDRPTTIAIRLLGGFSVLLDGQPVPARAWGSRKAQHLVKLLALAPGHRLTVDQLADHLWPHLEPDAARKSCYQTAYLARKVLDPEQRGLLPLRQEILALDLPGAFIIDREQFHAAAGRAARSNAASDYDAALALYTGALLPDDRYADWAALPRETTQHTYHHLLIASAEEATARRAFAIARERWQQLLADDPANEAAHTALMRLYAAEGQRQQALAQFRTLRDALRHELDTAPDPASEHLYAAILARQPLDARSASDADGTAGARHNLPAPTTALLGREAAITAIRAALAEARLVTLLGTGGIGKTRLALATGHAVHDGYPGGVWLLDLAALSDGALLDATLARVLGVRDAPGHALREAVIAALRHRPTLLILDNCEHLIAPCAELASALLAGCPALRLLATSREALRVAGELLWQVPGLPLPGEASDEAALRDNPAVGLFLARARLARPDFALTADTAATIATICRRLDGVPLAIELAAARVALLTPQQLAARLDDALRLLTGGPRTAPARQQTIRATLEWSYRLLDPAEQRLLARLAVFAGGGTLAAIEAICGLDAATIDVLAALVEKSLVQVDLGTGAEEPRYRQLETVRQFAAERLLAGGDEATWRAHHAAFFLHLAEEAEPHLRGEWQATWLARLTRDLDDLRAALAWYDQTARLIERVRLVNALERFWLSGNYLAEGLQWAERGVAAADQTIPQPVRAKALRVAGLLAFFNVDRRARAYAESSLALYRALGDQGGQAMVANTLGMAFRREGDHDRARAAFEEARALWRQTGDARGEIVAAANLASLHGDRDEWASAVALYEELIPLARRFRGSQMYPLLLLQASRCNAEAGRFAAVPALLSESIDLLTALNNRMDLGTAHVTLALHALGTGAAAQAARFLGALAKAAAVFTPRQDTRPDRAVARATAAIRATLGPAAFAAAHDQGYAWTIEEGFAQARAYLAA